MRHFVLGILAHVDSGKTTLSEEILYETGVLRTKGRVDKKDAFLDTHALEKERGITIFSKQALFPLSVDGEDVQVTLLDTPGHVDFSAEMERTLQVLDVAVLLINAADGVREHTKTLWELLKRYDIPTFLFVNKMDQETADRKTLIGEIQEKLSEACVDFSDEKEEGRMEQISLCSESALESFLETGAVEKEEIRKLVLDRRLFPCYFGSALKGEGVQELLAGIGQYFMLPTPCEEFGARVFKIGRDGQGNRLTYLKLTGGSLHVKDYLDVEHKREKINRICLFHGEKMEAVFEMEQGMVCALAGPEETYAGQGIGKEKERILPVLEPVMTYQLLFPEAGSASKYYPELKKFSEEIPELQVQWDEETDTIVFKMMGEIQLEVIRRLLCEKLGIPIEFGAGKIAYKETIKRAVEGVGHYEPLRHYAEVHLYMEPLEPGRGLEFASDCSEDELDRNWQRLILTNLSEKTHKGVLTGSPITDMRITLVAGKSHLKHTEGGDFRQAVYRAVRNGLRRTESVLLEPVFAFSIEVPMDAVGRLLTDLERMGAITEPLEVYGDMRRVQGVATVRKMQGYQGELLTYTKGQGRISLIPAGYRPSTEEEELVSQSGYDPDADLENPSGSIFCTHGAGFYVSWDEVEHYMHLPYKKEKRKKEEEILLPIENKAEEKREEISIGLEEIEKIINGTSFANKKPVPLAHKGIKAKTYREKPLEQSTFKPVKQAVRKKEYLLVDGYNVIFAWEELKELAKMNLDSARGKLLDVMSHYQAVRGSEVIIVFDAYRVERHEETVMDYLNIHVIFTKVAETADRFIERFAKENSSKYDITVVTSDYVEQIIIRGQGCRLVSSRELKEETDRAIKALLEEYNRKHL